MWRLFCLILCIAPLAAYAQPLVIGVEDQDYLPHSAIRDNRPVGFAPDLLRTFGQDIGREVVLRPLPINRLYAELLSGSIHAKYPDNPDWRGPKFRNQYHFAYSRQVVGIIDGVVVKPAFLQRPISDLRRLAMPLGFGVTDWTAKGGPAETSFVSSGGIDSLAQMCLLDRVEGCYANLDVLSIWLAENGHKGALVFDPRLPHSITGYFLSSVHRHDVVEMFDRWLVENPDRLIGLRGQYGLAPPQAMVAQITTIAAAPAQ